MCASPLVGRLFSEGVGSSPLLIFESGCFSVAEFRASLYILETKPLSDA